MLRAISKLLNLRRAEWPRFLVLYMTMFVTNIGFIWGRTIVETETLLQSGGLAALPWVLIGSAVGSLLVIAIYTAFADRIANDRLLVGIYLLSAVGIGVGLLLLYQGFVLLAYPLLYLMVLIAIDSFNIHWATYVNGFYDTQASKRIFPLLSSSARIASIIAGLTLLGLTLALSGSAIVVLATVALLLAALLTWLMPRLLGEARPAAVQAPRLGDTHAPQTSYLENIREGYRFVLQSSFLRWMAVSTFLLMILLALLTYQTSVILAHEFSARFPDAATSRKEMANFIGWVNALTNFLMLPFLFFLLSRIIARIGLGNANLIFPFGNLAISSSLIIAPGLASAGLAYFDRTTFRLTFQWTLDGLLYNAVPLRIKGRARAFIGGLVIPAGTLLGGLLLLLNQALPQSGPWLYGVPVLIGLLSIAYLATTFVIRRQYANALIKMLEQEDYSFLLSQSNSDLAAADPATLAGLRKKLEESQSPEFTLFMAKLITQIGGSEAVPILGQAAHTTSDPRVRAALLDLLAAAGTGGEAVRQLYSDFLGDPDGRVRQSAISGLADLAGPADTQFLAQAQAILADPDIDVRSQVLPPLLRSPDQAQREQARKRLDELLASPDPATRTAGVRVLGEVADMLTIRLLTRFLLDQDDQVRLEAALAVEQLGEQNRIPDLLVQLVLERAMAMARDPIERVRQAALSLIGRLGNRNTYPALVAALTDASPAVRATAADTLVQIGRAAIPIVHPQLETPDTQMRKMATVILSRVSPRDYGPLIDTLITGNLLAIYRNQARLEALTPCAAFAGVAVMQAALREQNQRLLDEVFYLLTATHPPGAVNIVRESLAGAEPRLRANAAEALEGLTSPQTAQLIAPLLDPSSTAGRLLALSRSVWDMHHPDLAQVFRELLSTSSEPFVRAIMTFSLGEIISVQSPVVAPPEPPRPQSRRRAADLLDTLSEHTDGTKPAPRRRASDLLKNLAENSDTPKPAEQPRRRTSELLNGISDSAKAHNQKPYLPFTLAEIETLLTAGESDQSDDVRIAVRSARRMIAGRGMIDLSEKEQQQMLSTIEKIIFLKEVPFFQAMTIDQLKVLANVCEEELFENDTRIFNQNDPGGALYVIISGRVGIEQEKRKGSFARIATIEAHSYFGEMNLFDNSPRSASAIALQDTLTLQLRREPLIALARQHPDLSLKLIDVLSQRLRETNDRVAELTRTRPRELHKLFDQFE